eukprot:3777261-Pyramimonas_sp.AAC.2
MVTRALSINEKKFAWKSETQVCRRARFRSTTQFGARAGMWCVGYNAFLLEYAAFTAYHTASLCAGIRRAAFGNQQAVFRAETGCKSTICQYNN